MYDSCEYLCWYIQKSVGTSINYAIIQKVYNKTSKMHQVT